MSHPTEITFAVLVTSDSASRGERADRSGALLKDILLAQRPKFKGILHQLRIVPDDMPTIRHALEGLLSTNSIDVILTTGGTGFGPRDVTTEATKPLITKDAPGLTHALYARSFEATPMAALSRLQAGIARETLIVNLPGSPKAVQECFQVLEPVLPHLIALLKNRDSDVKGTHEEMLSRPNSMSCPCGEPAKFSLDPNSAEKPPLNRLQTSSNSKEPVKTGFSVIDRPRHSQYPMVEVPQALNSIFDVLKSNHVGGTMMIETLDANGYVLAEDILAPEAHPPFRASIKDGYAVVAEDGAGPRHVLGSRPAGPGEGQTTVQSGTCVRVSTGAPVPDGADAVVQVEDTSITELTASGVEEKTIQIHSQPKAEQDIRPIGSDIAYGSILLHSGTILNPSDLGLLCSMGIGQVLVREKPKIGLMSTGDEILPWTTPGPLPHGQIRDSNGPMLQVLFKAQGFATLHLGAPKDNAEELRNFLIESFNKVDFIVSTGGVSMGEKDLLKHVLTTELNFKIEFGRLRMKPGKPTTFAHGKLPNSTGSHKFFFGLPGNPVSAFVVSHLLVLPALRYMSGRGAPSCTPPRVSVTLSHPLKLDPRPEYHRAKFVQPEDGSDRGDVIATSSMLVASTGSNQMSSRLASNTAGTLLLCLPSSDDYGKPRMDKGAIVDALLIGD